MKAFTTTRKKHVIICKIAKFWCKAFTYGKAYHDKLGVKKVGLSYIYVQIRKLRKAIFSLFSFGIFDSRYSAIFLRSVMTTHYRWNREPAKLDELQTLPKAVFHLNRIAPKRSVLLCNLSGRVSLDKKKFSTLPSIEVENGYNAFFSRMKAAGWNWYPRPGQYNNLVFWGRLFVFKFKNIFPGMLPDSVRVFICYVLK